MIFTALDLQLSNLSLNLNPWEGWLKHRLLYLWVSDSVGLGLSPRICISIKFPYDAHVPSPGNHTLRTISLDSSWNQVSSEEMFIMHFSTTIIGMMDCFFSNVVIIPNKVSPDDFLWVRNQIWTHFCDLYGEGNKGEEAQSTALLYWG